MPFTRRHLLQTASIGADLGSLLDIGSQWPLVRVLAAKRSRSSTLMIASPCSSSSTTPARGVDDYISRRSRPN